MSRDNIYQLLRDAGLYKHTYAQAELQQLAFTIEKEPGNIVEHIIQWAIKGYKKPGEFYGTTEDTSKTIIARYVLDKGGSPRQAVKFADKLLFDYTSVSEAVILSMFKCLRVKMMVIRFSIPILFSVKADIVNNFSIF